tara:strand:+ start:11030 stop:11422 length:393 start_codon:yes stop_codon:yes gene_type:complete
MALEAPNQSNPVNEKGDHMVAFFMGKRLVESACGHFLLPRSVRQLLASFFRQGVPIFVLNESIQVKIGDALADARLSNMQVGVLFDSLPKITLQNRKANVALVLDFMLLDDVQNHVVILVKRVHGSGFVR